MQCKHYQCPESIATVSQLCVYKCVPVELVDAPDSTLTLISGLFLHTHTPSQNAFWKDCQDYPVRGIRVCMSMCACFCGPGAICVANELREIKRHYGLLVGGGSIHSLCDLCVPVHMGATEVLHPEV